MSTHITAATPQRVIVGVSVTHPAGCRCTWYTLRARAGRTIAPPAGGFSSASQMTWRQSVRFGVLRIGGCRGRYRDGATVTMPHANEMTFGLGRRMGLALGFWKPFTIQRSHAS